MSALGQKQTYTVHKAMSALPPIATAKADFRTGHVCFTPESGRVQCTRPCLLWAKSGHPIIYSIISSARACIDGGTLMPSALAALRLMTNSNLVACKTGNSAGFSPLRTLPV
jgi:hypothetical protein